MSNWSDGISWGGNGGPNVDWSSIGNAWNAFRQRQQQSQQLKDLLTSGSTGSTGSKIGSMLGGNAFASSGSGSPSDNGGYQGGGNAFNTPSGPGANIPVDSSGHIDPVAFSRAMRDKVSESALNGQHPEWAKQFGVTNGTPDEWARFFTMVQQQESGNRVARTNSNGSLQRFGSTIPTEMSFGPGQFNKGEYGLNTWADVNNPSKVGDAYINVALANRFPSYFGSVQRPNEVLQHRGWYDRTVAPRMSYGDF